MNFRIKVNGIVDGKKINTLVGVSGLIKLVGIEMANKMIRRAFNGKGDKMECKLRRSIKVVFYNRPGGFPEPNTNSYEFGKKKQIK